MSSVDRVCPCADHLRQEGQRRAGPGHITDDGHARYFHGRIIKPASSGRRRWRVNLGQNGVPPVKGARPEPGNQAAARCRSPCRPDRAAEPPRISSARTRGQRETSPEARPGRRNRRYARTPSGLEQQHRLAQHDSASPVSWKVRRKSRRGRSCRVAKSAVGIEGGRITLSKRHPRAQPISIYRRARRLQHRGGNIHAETPRGGVCPGNADQVARRAAADLQHGATIRHRKISYAGCRGPADTACV